jgi:hypothetical protein
MESTTNRGASAAGLRTFLKGRWSRSNNVSTSVGDLGGQRPLICACVEEGDGGSAVVGRL